MIRFLPRAWHLAVLCMLLVGGAGGAGCLSRPRAADVRSTPPAPVWSPETIGQTLRTLAAAGSVLERSVQTSDAAQRAERVADYLADRLHDTGIQPGAGAYRLHVLSTPTGTAPSDSAAAAYPLVVGLVAGRDPFASSDAVLIYAALRPEQAGHVDLAAWLELGRVYAELGRFYRFPVCSIVLLMPVGGDQQAALESYRRHPVWPLDRIRAVLSLGTDAPDAAAWHAIGIADSVEVARFEAAAPLGAEDSPALQAVALAGAGYAWLLPHVGAAPAPPGL